MNVLLIFPPQAQPFLPNLALPSLRSFLEKNSHHQVSLIDANIESYEYFLSEEFLMDRDKTFIEKLELAKNFLRHNEEYYPHREYYESISILQSTLGEISERYSGTHLDLKDFTMEYSHSSSEHIIRATRDHSKNPYLEFFQKKIIPKISDFQPGLVGISICWPSQLIPGFTLSRLIQIAKPGIHVTVGGSMITHLGDFLIHKRKFFSLCSSFILYEGEIPLLQLADALERGKKLSEVPGLIYPEGKKNVHYNEHKIPESLKELPCPNFDGLNLSRYFSPKLYLPLSTSRGCYWGKCKFCGHSFSLSKYRPRPIQLLIEDMIHLNSTTSTSHFYFVDDAIPLNVINKLPDLLKNMGKDFKWGGEIRLDKALLKTDFSAIYQGGCRFLLFGLESYCQRVLDLMNKGIQKDIVIDILRKSHDSGIINWVFVFLGFPGETKEEALLTLDFISRNGDIIDMIAAGRFILTRNSYVYKNPQDYGFEKIEIPSMEKDLITTYHFKPTKGPTPDEIIEMLNNAKIRPDFHKFLKPFVTEVHLMFLRKSDISSTFSF